MSEEKEKEKYNPEHDDTSSPEVEQEVEEIFKVKRQTFLPKSNQTKWSSMAG